MFLQPSIGSFALLTIYRVNFAISTVFVVVSSQQHSANKLQRTWCESGFDFRLILQISSHQLVGPDREADGAAQVKCGLILSAN